ncbi:MAG: DUF393 domain-containing protein [Myxococcaceae bacterium]|nr:DUF393 domain-containing protein [Myxococcaceae bacterium]
MASFSKPRDILFYDGSCGLCHASVKFVLKHERENNTDFSPLGSEAFRSRVNEAQRSVLPDSLVVWTSDGRLLVKSAAVVHLGRRLGGFWKVLANVGNLLPDFLLDAVYDFIARNRQKVFKKPDGACPMIPPQHRPRFLLDE